MIRMATAHAKMHLRSEINHEDINVSIECLLESFVQTQKHSVAKSIKRKFADFHHNYSYN